MGKLMPLKSVYVSQKIAGKVNQGRKEATLQRFQRPDWVQFIEALRDFCSSIVDMSTFSEH
jgi:hypothetical protein